MKRIDSKTTPEPVPPMDKHLPPTRQQAPSGEAAERQELGSAIATLQEATRVELKSAEMRLDPDLDMVVVTIREQGSRRVLRQIPPAEVLKLAKAIRAGNQRLLDRLI